jgi:hypothetical protein
MHALSPKLVITCLLPLILATFEYLVRDALKLTDAQYVGPSFASAGFGLVLGLVLPPVAHDPFRDLKDAVLRQQATIEFLNLTKARDWSIVALLVALVVWAVAMYLSINPARQSVLIFGLTSSFWVGLLGYFFGLLSTFVHARYVA